MIATSLICVAAVPAAAQSRGTQSQPVAPPAACPPGISNGAPVIGREDPNKSLSEKLAQSKGIICPPAGIDPDMHVKPPEGGEIEIIPPPGTPGGDPRLLPK